MCTIGDCPASPPEIRLEESDARGGGDAIGTDQTGSGGHPVTSDSVPMVTAVRDRRAEAALRAGLAEYNTKRFRPGDRATLDIVVYDDQNGEPVGGLLGNTSFGLFFLDLFYLPEALRERGLGSRILALAEGEARRRGCSAAFVYTVTFQAPEFYERHGYRRFGEIACPPDGATRVFFTKSLDANPTPIRGGQSALPQ
jgi:GNAT superfamily N-acetyltransferase